MRKDVMTMFRKTGIAALTALSLSAGGAYAAGGEAVITDIDFSFEGPFGTFDQVQLQRGLKVYTQVCSACHGMEYVPLRTLSAEGGPNLPADQMRAYAERWEVYDEEADEYRTAKPTDHFPESQLANAPDLSLMAKKRAGFHGPYGTGISQFINGMGGPEYMYSLLTGYEDPPACAPDDMEGSYNVAFTAGGYPSECKDADGNPTVPGSWINMAKPLWGEDVEYDDGTFASVEQQSEDVAAFLTWAAEPKMMARKNAGLTGVIFLTVLSVLLYLVNKRLWKPIKGKK